MVNAGKILRTALLVGALGCFGYIVYTNPFIKLKSGHTQTVKKTSPHQVFVMRSEWDKYSANFFGDRRMNAFFTIKDKLLDDELLPELHLRVESYSKNEETIEVDYYDYGCDLEDISVNRVVIGGVEHFRRVKPEYFRTKVDPVVKEIVERMNLSNIVEEELNKSNPELEDVLGE